MSFAFFCTWLPHTRVFYNSVKLGTVLYPSCNFLLYSSNAWEKCTQVWYINCSNTVSGSFLITRGFLNIWFFQPPSTHFFLLNLRSCVLPYVLTAFVLLPHLPTKTLYDCTHHGIHIPHNILPSYQLTC